MISPYLVALVSAGVAAQASKYVIASSKRGDFRDLSLFYASGGMPSVHSSVVTSLLPALAVYEGVGSGIFSLAALLALIVMYDALTVRRSSGEQGLAIVEFIKSSGKKTKSPFVALGHTPIEVFVGALVGLIVGTIVVFGFSIT